MGAKLNGIELEWRERGAGQVILFVHGFPFNSAMWEPQLKALPEGWRGIAPDLRGFGASTDGTEDVFDMDLFARDLAALLDHLDIDRVVVCGLSMGGYVAFRFWHLFRSRVRALVLADTWAGPDSPEAARARARLADGVRQEGIRPVVDALLPKLVSFSTRHNQKGTVETIRAMMRETPPESMAKALLGMARRPDSEDLLRTIDVPVLAVLGSEDAITTRGQAEMLARGIRGGRLEIIEGAGHVSNMEQPDAFNRALEQFLTGLPTIELSVSNTIGL
jgi:pimeloyl-ACP methyl ester carboxylesterase